MTSCPASPTMTSRSAVPVRTSSSLVPAMVGASPPQVTTPAVAGEPSATGTSAAAPQQKGSGQPPDDAMTR